MSVAFINFSDGKYIKGQQRLRKSLLSNGVKPEQILFWNSYPKHWPTDTEVFKGFKPHAFKDAENAGFTAAIWLDANCICVRSTHDIENLLEEQGVYVFSRYSETVGNWISDYSLENLGIDREYTHSMPELTTCVVGINFLHPSGRLLLEQWQKHAEEKEAYNGVPEPYTFADTRDNDDNLLSEDPRVKGHRTDQSIVGVLAGSMKIFPDNRYVFDLIGESSRHQRYAKYIPPEVIFVQNRDIKKDDGYLNDLSCYFSKNSFFYSLGRHVYTLQRKLKDRIKWFIHYRKWYTFR